MQVRGHFILSLVSKRRNSNRPCQPGEGLVWGASAVEAEAVLVQVALELLTSAVVGSGQKCFEVVQCLVQPHQIPAGAVVDLRIYSNILQTIVGLISAPANWNLAEFFPSASVGEAISLPCGTTWQNGIGSGEFVQIRNVIPFNQPLKKRSVAGGW